MPRHIGTTIQVKSALPKLYVKYLIVLYYEHALILARLPCGGGGYRTIRSVS